MYSHIVGSALIALPFYTRISLYVVDTVHSKNLVFAFYTTLLIILFGISKKPQRLSILFAILILHTFLNVYDIFSPFVAYQMAGLFFGMMFLLSLFSNDIDIKIISNYLVTSAIIQSGWILGEAFNVHWYQFVAHNPFGGEVTIVNRNGDTFTPIQNMTLIGSLGNPNYTGAFLASSVFAFMRGKFWYLIPIPIASIIALGSMMPMVSLFVGMLFYFLLKSKHLKDLALYITLLAIAGLAAITIFAPNTSFLGNSYRFETWISAWPKILDKWLFGNGLGHFANFGEKIVNHPLPFRQLHNEVIEWVYAYGLVGIGYLYFLFKPVFCDWKKKDALLIAWGACILINSLGHFYFHISSTACIGLIIFSLLYREEKKEKTLTGVI